MSPKKTEIERLLLEVYDSTQFPTKDEAPGLRDLDSALCCGICGDHLQGPMMLSCGHSFCSLCIRTSLRERAECPHCRSRAEEMNLLKNVTLEEISLAWQLARPFVLRLIDEKKKLEDQIRALEFNERPKKKRRTDGSSSSAQSIRTVASQGTHLLSADSQSADYAEVMIEEAGPPRSEVVSSSDTEENESVHCPVCKRSVRMLNINQHLDNECKSHLEEGPSRTFRTSAKSAWKDVFENGREKGKVKEGSSIPDPLDDEKLPKRSYDMLNTKRVKELLQEVGLPINGTRDQLIARHGYYVLLYNANLDLPPSHRKNLQKLRKELRIWEESQTKKKITVDSPRDYLKANDDTFREHVAAARASAIKLRIQQKDVKLSSGVSDAAYACESFRIKPDIRSEEVVPDSDEE